jgi:hypothetical protein
MAAIQRRVYRPNAVNGGQIGKLVTESRRKTVGKAEA